MAVASEPIRTLVILGAGGDLSSRLLLPGLGSLLASSRGRDLHLIGADRGDLTPGQWRQTVRKAFSGTKSELGAKIVAGTTYVQTDVTNPEQLQRVLEAAEGRTALYFALPPAIAAEACAQLRTLELPKGLVLALEKPFGTDYASARRLNRLLETMVAEDQVFRVDHFLGKSTVLDLLGLRFANRVFEPLFSAQNVERVEIEFDEQLALEGRAGYYDKAGALVDMIQSHLLQVLALIAMEPPASVSSEDLRGGMAQALRAARPWKADGTSSRRARYTAGTIDGRKLPAYASEKGVVAARRTETLTEIAVAVDTWRWAGTPFILRSGKALGDAHQRVVFTLRPVPHLPTGFRGPSRPAQLVVGMKPAGIELDIVLNGADDPFDLEWRSLAAEIPPNELTAYGEVLGELLEGDPTLSVRGDVAEQCWRIVAPFLTAWKKDAVPLESYPAGSVGPKRWSRPLA